MNNNSMLKSIYGLITLTNISHLFSSEIQAIGQDARHNPAALQKLRIDEIRNYERTQFSSFAATVDLLKQKTVPVNGESTFKNRTLTEDTIITSVKILNTEAATADTTIGTANYSFKLDSFKSELLNADLVIRYNGSEAVKLPLRDLVYDGDEKRNLEGYFGKNLLTPLVVKAGQAIEAQIVMPDGVTCNPGANNAFFTEIQFGGARVKVRTS